MARPTRTTKQIAEKYKGNLDYFRKPHAFRMVRLICFLVAVVGSIGAVLGFRYYGNQSLTFFSTGPLSANHSRFANRCDVCHQDAQPDVIRALHLDTDPKSVTMKDVQAKSDSVIATFLDQFDSKHLQREREDLERQMTENTSLARLDEACMRCHEAQRLHQPQTRALSVVKMAPQISLVHATACSVCHREHLGPDKMKAPPPSNCSDCHGNKERLLAGLKLITTKAKPIPPTGKISDELEDGVRRFIAPRDVPHQPVVFTSFADGHPAFGYEAPGARDSAKILYGHARHERDDVKLGDRKLECGDCHKPGADGIYMQPVRYEENCKRCHSLQFDPDLPKLPIPHRDADKVYDFLQGKASEYFKYFKSEHPEITDVASQRAFVEEHLLNLIRHYGDTSGRRLELAVFMTGDPPISDRLVTKSNTAQALPACRKCHEGVKESAEGSHKWIIPKTDMADRWITRGPFTHAPHNHISCMDCHAKALASNKTSDILLPTQKSCTDCHRPLDASKAEESSTDRKPAPKTGIELVGQQRMEGGIKADCQSCHPKYHTSDQNNEAVKAAGWLRGS